MFKIIRELKAADPKRRQQLLFRTHERNVAYFKQVNPQLAEFIEARGTADYMIEITDRSLNIRHAQTKQCFHPPGELFQYMNDLGAWHHTGWVDKVGILPVFRGAGPHGKLVAEMTEHLYETLPALKQRLAAGEVSLPALKDGRRYSGPTVFLGIFTGLHIMCYLNRTVIANAVFFEPDLDKFALSCYFLDYTELHRVMRGRLLLHVGEEAPDKTIGLAIADNPVTGSAWLRMLPCYPEGKFDDIINRIALRWRAQSEIFVPYDREQRNLQYAVRNIKDHYPFPHKPPRLSPGCTICVLASGPSLGADMEWVRRNQDRMIIMCSISSFRVIKENGIRVDFQCTLDTELDEPLLETLGLDLDITLATYYKLDPAILKRFRKSLMIPEEYKANAVRLFHSFPPTHPTTGNLITALAVWLKPSMLLFVGTDFGYKDKALTHVKGSWYDDNDGLGHVIETQGRDHYMVKANFPESEGQIVTTAYYNNARGGVEGALTWLKDTDVKVYNLSDGARAEGAQPLHSAELDLPDYPAKAADIQAIEDAFDDQYDDIFEPYASKGREVIDTLTERMMAELEMEPFDWAKFSPAIDLAWSRALQVVIQKYREFRVEMFAKLIQDLLAEWYRAMTLTHTPEETELVYRAGLKKFKETMDALPWPDELDSLTPEQVDSPVEAPALA